MVNAEVGHGVMRVVRSRRRQGFGEVAFEAAGEQAVQHAVRDAPSEANDDRSVAADGIASARPLADDRVGDDSSDFLGGQPFAFARERLGLCDDGLHERVVATAPFRGHAAGDALGGDDKATCNLGGDRAWFDDDDFHAEIGDLAAQRIADSLEGELGTGVGSVACHRHLAPDEVTLTTVPRLSMSVGRSACVMATWPNRLTSNRRRHSESGSASTGALTWIPALLTRARSGRRSGSSAMRFTSIAISASLVMSSWLGSTFADRIASASASERTPART